jgi:hypothetical protein
MRFAAIAAADGNHLTLEADARPDWAGALATGWLP